MRHVSEGALRRLVDEPFAVPDAARRHLDGCGQCRASSGQIAEDAALASRLLAAPRLAVDTDQALAQLRRRLERPEIARKAAARIPRHPAGRMVNVSAYTGVALTTGLLVGGAATAATLTTVFAPTKVTTVPVTGGDLRAAESVLGIGTSTSAGQVMPGGGARALPFGELRWSSGRPGPVASVAAARAATGLDVTVPARLPAGVGAQAGVFVQPRATATITFRQDAGSGVGGTALTVSAGPAVLVRYGSVSSGSNVTTLGILTMRRPTAASSGATTRPLEAFLLGRPGLPAGLVRQVRRLGNLSTVLPVPVPPGAQSQHVTIGGARGVLITVASGVASAVVWETPGGTIHAVAGLLDQKDLLDVARQLG